MSYDAAAAAFLCTLLLCNFCSARDNVTTLVPLTGDTDETLGSAENKFVLGFFTPSNIAANRWYIGIWYSIDPGAVVWVANRDKPLPHRSDGIFTIDEEDGNLKLLDASHPDELSHYYFSTNLPSSPEISRTAKLLDTGNLVLINDLTGDILWQSFNNPTDTFLPGMKMDENLTLTSWKNRGDPAKGNFTFRQDQENNGFTIFRISISISEPYWKSSGTESSRSIFNLNKMNPSVDHLLSNSSSQTFSALPAPSPKNDGNKKKLPSVVDRVNFTSTRLIINFTGEIQYLCWDDLTKKWEIRWLRPTGPCGVNKACGVFGSCKSSSTKTDTPACTCFRGFEPSSPDKWNSNDFSDGCKRSSDICKQKGGNDTFFNVGVINAENLSPTAGLSEQQCREDCLSKCHCQAYYYYSPTTRNPKDSVADNASLCWTSEVELTNIQEGYAPDIHNLSIRVATPLKGVENPRQSGGSQPKRNKSSSPSAVIISITVIVAIALFCSIGYIAYLRMKTKRKETERIQEKPVFQLYDSEKRVEDLIDQGDQFREDDKKDIGVPFFELESILAATGNFSQANKLGQGGFGPVYKGEFPGEKEIAVKRLSSNSVQGLKEFKNEVVLIAKLQHRNLVRLLGYCIMGNEKILLYEYMPNKSLDAFIFDEKLSMLLDWTKRFDIILGVARGLLYLHQDSRLRIIHRDMKASNVLLDEEMNPKISDFGLARIVGGRETEANTNRVVGTYGYMSPEYVLEGQFSIKSDVFSFGVVVLEIISGKKNSGFYQSQLVWNLVGYAWNLWKEEKPLELLDQTLVESCNESEVLKCIMVGLLCVQEDPGDRPNMSKVLFMLNSEMETLPNPKQPAFISRKRFSGTGTTSSSSSIKPETLSRNEITFSMEEGR